MPGLQLIREDFGQSKRVNTPLPQKVLWEACSLEMARFCFLCKRQDLLQLETLLVSGAPGFAQGHGPDGDLGRSGCSLGSSS